MGLEIEVQGTDETIWMSSYTGFSEFRCEVAKALGFHQYCRLGSFSQLIWLTQSKIEQLNKEVEELMEKNPRWKPFFHHSDCDGKWTVKECRLIKTLIEEVQDKLPEQWKESVETLLSGLELCIQRKKAAIFC